MSGKDSDDVVTISDDKDPTPPSTSSNLTKKTTQLSSGAQSRMSLLSTACKKHEFVPFTKDGHTLFVKFNIDMDEKANQGSVATFTIRLLIEGYWTLFVHGKKLQKSHHIYEKFSNANTLASSSKNYKLDISKVSQLFAYLNGCTFCIGHPEMYHLSRFANQTDTNGLTVIPQADSVEVLRNVRWKGKNYPSTLVHKNCELIRYTKENDSDIHFRCDQCENISNTLMDLNAKAIQLFIKNGGTMENAASIFNDSNSTASQPTLNYNGTLNTFAPVVSPISVPAVTPIVAPSAPPVPVPTVFLAPDPNGPTFLLAKNEEERYYVLQSTDGDFYCGICNPVPFLFPQQHERVSYNEHMWMKHHVFIDSISIWCDVCHKPFFDKGRFRLHVLRDHPNA